MLNSAFPSLKASQDFSQCRNLIFDKREQEETSQKSSSYEKTRSWPFTVWALAHFGVEFSDMDVLEGLFSERALRKRRESILAARKESPLTGYCWKRKLRGKCEWNRWFAIWLAWSNPTELPGQPDGEQINYFIQTQRYSGRVFRYNTVRGMKREEVLADTGHEKRDGVFSKGC